MNLIAIEVEAGDDAKIIPLASGLPDEMFEHDGQITKREIRAVTLSSLAPRAGELLWDIGCGSGSIAIEWLLRHPAMKAIAVERDSARAARAAGNSAELGVPRLEIVTGAAPAALEGLPRPDAIFIGGGGDLGELGDLGETAGDGDARDRMLAQIFEHAADEIAHVDQAPSGRP